MRWHAQSPKRENMPTKNTTPENVSFRNEREVNPPQDYRKLRGYNNHKKCLIELYI